MNSSAIDRALCSTWIRGGGSVIEVGLPTTSSDTNSSRVSVFDFKTIVRIRPSTVIGARSSLLRPPIAVTSFLLTCQQGFLGILSGMERQDRQKPTSPRC